MFIKKIILIALTISGPLLAQDTIQGTYSYTYGDSESLVEARQTCKDLALREAIESYAIFVESSTEVQDFQMKEDIIHTISAGYLQNVKIVDQKEEGRSITITVEASVDSNSVQSVIANRISQKDVVQVTEVDFAEQEVAQVVESRQEEDPSNEKQSAFNAYKQRMNSVENLWRQKKYSEAAYSLDKINAEIVKHKPAKTGTYRWYLYSVISKHTALVKELIRQEHLATQGKKAIEQAHRKTIFEKSIQLRSGLLGFEKLTNLTDNQKRVRKVHARRSRKTLESIKKKYGMPKR